MSTLGAFGWYELRTTDPGAARSFYEEVVGWRVEQAGPSTIFYSEKSPVGGVSELPERARALGAPSHWLGFIQVLDVDAIINRMVALGAEVRGPVRQDAGGGRVAVLRDPQGAAMALSSGGERESRFGIAWHELHTTDHRRAWSIYAELFGWQAREIADLGPEIGEYQMFSWASAEDIVGGMVSSARRPHIHTHWLFYLTVPDIDDSIDKVRSMGGSVVNGPVEVRGNARIAYCEDPQGAAFALHQSIE
ncbi:MAG: VOC family protein [Polyangiaceae bacterium]|nr:VOC family protein [Polyangiaceae bacterium]